MCIACRAPEVWKNGSLRVAGSAICKSRVSSLVGQGLQHMQISVNQKHCGEGDRCCLAAELCKTVYWRDRVRERNRETRPVASSRHVSERKNQRDSTDGEQLKGYNFSNYVGFSSLKFFTASQILSVYRTDWHINANIQIQKLQFLKWILA